MGHEAKHPIIIGITGNIGSGKSTVAALLRSWGYPVLDLDALAARARENKEEELKRLFPEAVVGGGWTGGPSPGSSFPTRRGSRPSSAVVHPEVRRLLMEELSRLEAPSSFWRSPSSLRRGGREAPRDPLGGGPPGGAGEAGDGALGAFPGGGPGPGAGPDARGGEAQAGDLGLGEHGEPSRTWKGP